MKAALKRGVDSGTLVQVKNSYKVSPDAKKVMKAKKPVSEAKAKVVKKVSDYQKAESNRLPLLR